MLPQATTCHPTEPPHNPPQTKRSYGNLSVFPLSQEPHSFLLFCPTEKCGKRALKKIKRTKKPKLK